MFGVLNLGPAASAFRRGFDVVFEISPKWLRDHHPAESLGESLEKSGEMTSVIRNLQRSGWVWSTDDTHPEAHARLIAPAELRPSGGALTAAAGRTGRLHVNVAIDRDFHLTRAQTWLAPRGLSGDTLVLSDGKLTLLIDGHSSGRVGASEWAAPTYQQWLRHLEPSRAVTLFATRDPIAILDALVEHREQLADPELAASLLRR